MSVDVAVEYAKSNRSSCRGCFTTIDKDTVRIGTLLTYYRGLFCVLVIHSPGTFYCIVALYHPK